MEKKVNIKKELNQILQSSGFSVVEDSGWIRDFRMQTPILEVNGQRVEQAPRQIQYRIEVEGEDLGIVSDPPVAMIQIGLSLLEEGVEFRKFSELFSYTEQGLTDCIRLINSFLTS